MKNKLSKILIALSILISSTGCAFSYTLTQEELGGIIKSEIQKTTQKYVDELGGGEIEVKILNLPYGNFETKNKPTVRVESNFDKYMYRDIKRITIKDGESFVRAFPVSVNILVYKNVLSASNPILRNDPLNISNTSVKRMEIGQYLGQTMDSLGKKPYVAMRNYQKGNVILKNYIKSKPDVLKDSLVNIVFQSNDTLKIQVDGKALKEGSIGDIITVRSIKFNKIYNAEVSNKNEVTVKI